MYNEELKELVSMIELLVDNDYNVNAGGEIDIDIVGFITDNTNESIGKNEVILQLIDDGYWVRNLKGDIYLIKPNV